MLHVTEVRLHSVIYSDDKHLHRSPLQASLIFYSEASSSWYVFHVYTTWYIPSRPLPGTQLPHDSLACFHCLSGNEYVSFSFLSSILKWTRFLHKLYIGEVVLGTAFGIIMGPHCASIFDPRSWSSSVEMQNRITLEVMRVVLATGLFVIGVELPKAYLKKHARSLLLMVRYKPVFELSPHLSHFRWSIFHLRV